MLMSAISYSSVCGLFLLIFCCVPMPGLAQVGIASKYVADQGIMNDPDVILAENFESSLPTILSRFNGYSQGAVVQSTDKPAASGGTKSVLIHPTGGTLFKLLPGDYDQLYVRYYIKYSGRDYHHSGGYMGGYWPRSAWPMGDAGLKGTRSDGSRLINIGFETQGADNEADPDTRLDTYMNWIDMAGQEIGGGWWGRNVLGDLNLPIRPGVWQCVELMVKMNSATTAHDGELAIWIDGVLKAHFRPGSPNGQFNSFSGNWEMNPADPAFTGFQWRDILSYGINWVKIQNYDDLGPQTDLLTDDLVVATKYIGPLSPSGPDVTPPAPPSNLRFIP